MIASEDVCAVVEVLVFKKRRWDVSGEDGEMERRKTEGAACYIRQHKLTSGAFGVCQFRSMGPDGHGTLTGVSQSKVEAPLSEP